MLIKAKKLVNYKLNCLDGEIGEIKEFYFDDQYWTIRYLVAQTGSWLTDRQVLISPYAMESVNKEEEHIDVNLTKKQVEDSPPWDNDNHVSRQFEKSYNEYFGWPSYWGGSYVWGHDPYPILDRPQANQAMQTQQEWDHHLRSTKSVCSYDIRAMDIEVGHIEDFIIDDTTLTIRYLIVNTQNWWPGKNVLISPRWIELVSWEESIVFIKLFGKTIQQSPEYTEDTLITLEYEAKLHDHYNRQGYWVDEPKSDISEA